MKQIIGAIFLSLALALGFVACSNDGGVNSVLSLKKTDFTDLHIYAGNTDKGATAMQIKENTSQNKDSLYRALVRDRYLKSFQQAVDAANKISFEFLANGMLSFHDIEDRTKIISEYVYEDNNLYILKGGTTKVYVATKGDDGIHYRRKAIMRRHYDGKVATNEDAVSYDDKMLDLDDALEFGEYETKEKMTNPKDSLFWCNVKYIYNH